jgi:hypothetical protein
MGWVRKPIHVPDFVTAQTRRILVAMGAEAALVVSDFVTNKENAARSKSRAARA